MHGFALDSDLDESPAKPHPAGENRYARSGCPDGHVYGLWCTNAPQSIPLWLLAEALSKPASVHASLLACTVKLLKDHQVTAVAGRKGQSFGHVPSKRPIACAHAEEPLKARNGGASMQSTPATGAPNAAQQQQQQQHPEASAVTLAAGIGVCATLEHIGPVDSSAGKAQEISPETTQTGINLRARLLPTAAASPSAKPGRHLLLRQGHSQAPSVGDNIPGSSCLVLGDNSNELGPLQNFVPLYTAESCTGSQHAWQSTGGGELATAAGTGVPIQAGVAAAAAITGAAPSTAVEPAQRMSVRQTTLQMAGRPPPVPVGPMTDGVIRGRKRLPAVPKQKQLTLFGTPMPAPLGGGAGAPLDPAVLVNATEKGGVGSRNDTAADTEAMASRKPGKRQSRAVAKKTGAHPMARKADKEAFDPGDASPEGDVAADPVDGSASLDSGSQSSSQDSDFQPKGMLAVPVPKHHLGCGSCLCLCDGHTHAPAEVGVCDKCRSWKAEKATVRAGAGKWQDTARQQGSAVPTGGRGGSSAGW